MYYLLRFVSLLIGSLSPKGIDLFARGLTWLMFDALRLRRRLILSNLQRAFPEKSEEERRRIGRESVRNFFLTVLEFFAGSRRDIAGSVRLIDDHHLRDALAKKQGVYILCMHMGNWEAQGAKISRAICPAHVVVKRVGSAGVDRFVSEQRHRAGFITIQRQKKGDGFRKMLEALNRGEIVGFVMDQARPGSPRLPFFGHPAKTNTSFAGIWRKRPAPIIFSYIKRTAVGEHEIRFFPEVVLETTDDLEKDVIEHSLVFNRILEDCIRANPEQYFWMHDRWK